MRLKISRQEGKKKKKDRNFVYLSIKRLKSLGEM